jgi:hypothetical protein
MQQRNTWCGWRRGSEIRRGWEHCGGVRRPATQRQDTPAQQDADLEHSTTNGRTRGGRRRVNN